MAVAANTDLSLDPDLERARELARDANVVPVAYRFVEDTETPVSAFLKLRDEGPAFLLESADYGRVGRWSFLGFRPRSILRWSEGRLSESRGGEVAERDAADPYAAVEEYLARYAIAAIDGLPPFAGGAVGFFGYDLVRTVESLAPPNPDPLGLPDMALMEEFELCRRLRKLGRLALADATILTSARRFARQGVIRTYLRMWRVATQYRLGTPPNELRRIYEQG